MTAPGNGRAGAHAARTAGGDRFGVAAPGASPPAASSRVRAGEDSEAQQPASRWQRLARWQQVMVFVAAGLLLAGGGFLTGWLTTGAEVRALRLTNEVHAGARFVSQDLEVVGVSTNVEGLVPAGRKEEIVGQTARTNLPTGALLQQAHHTPQSNLPGPNQALVPVKLKPGQAPSGLAVGDLVTVVAPPADSAQGSDPAPRELVAKAPVWSIREASGGQSDTRTVTLVVPEGSSTRLAALAVSGPVALYRAGGEQQ